VEFPAAERYRPLTALPFAAAYVDPEGAILSSNQTLDPLLRNHAGDGSPDENRFDVIFVPEDREQVREILAGPASRVRRRLRIAAASAVNLRAEFVPIKRRVQAGIVWLVVLRPNETVTQLTPELAAKTALTERYVDDLRAPVQDVLGWASLLRRSRDEPERLEQALATIERNAELLMNLLQRLLEETRPPEIGRGTGRGAAGSSQVA
jgi:signal transduction histidine kinase